MTTFSLVVPAHDAEGTIRRCLDSILCQGYRDLQVVVVDDGSRDSTAQICRDYAERDARVSVASTPHGGVGAARNLGLALCGGDVVGFVDADDWLAPCALRMVADDLASHDVDAVAVGFSLVEGKKVRLADNYPGLGGVVPARRLQERCLDVGAHKTLCAVWTCYLRRDVLQASGERFASDMTMLEDLHFLYRVLGAARSVYVERRHLYCYRQGAGSASHGYRADYGHCVDAVEDEFRAGGEKPERVRAYQAHMAVELVKNECRRPGATPGQAGEYACLLADRMDLAPAGVLALRPLMLGRYWGAALLLAANPDLMGRLVWRHVRGVGGAR